LKPEVIADRIARGPTRQLIVEASAHFFIDPLGG
jgi:hypothetical protein